MHIFPGWKKKEEKETITEKEKNQRIQKLKAILETGVSINNSMFSRVDRSKNVETKRPPGTWLTNPSHIAFQRKTSRNTEARHPSSNLTTLQDLLLHTLKKKKGRTNILIETFSLRFFFTILLPYFQLSYRHCLKRNIFRQDFSR